ncbi:MAG TPA: VOC family protein [Mycobacteriales bacterium]|nr:VOC family protein [Mycobacteriales bacterium]
MELALVVLAVTDLHRSVGFYRQALGWEQVEAAPVYAELVSPAGLRLGLYERTAFARNPGTAPPTAPSGTSATELYFRTADVDAAVSRLQAAGAELLSPRVLRDWGDEAAYLADPDGNVVVVACPAAGAGMMDG